MHGPINLLWNFICFSIISTHFGLFVYSCEDPTLSFNQIGEFVEAVREPFFKQIVTNGRPTDGGEDGGDEQWTEHLGNKLIHTGVRIGTIQLIRAINSRIYDVEQIIVDKVNSLRSAEQQSDEQSYKEMVRETKARLTVRELFAIATRIVRYKILHRLTSPNLVEKSKLCTWWYRFRYQVDSGAKFVDVGTVSEIRLGMMQYYQGIYEEFSKLIEQFDRDHEHLTDALQMLDANWNFMKFKLRSTQAEQADFDPNIELPQEKLAVLMHKPVENEVPVYVFCEKFPLPYNLGTCFQALGVTHRGVKVYDIEFHFGYCEGILIADKIRKRSDDPERGMKFNLIGWTKKSQWEVQKIFDNFNDFYTENGQFREGKFSLSKYNLQENNCIDFSRQFVEALLEGDGQLKTRQWPPTFLRQPSINNRSCGFPNCFTSANMPDSDK